MFLVGIVLGLGLGAGGVLLIGAEPGVWLRNGILDGWEVTRDNETLLCRDPIVYVRAKQIECE